MLNYTLKGQLIPPVGARVCMCLEVEDVRPLKVNGGVTMDFETGLFQHKSPLCNSPLPSMIQNCDGCFKDFWGYYRDHYCNDCLPYA